MYARSAGIGGTTGVLAATGLGLPFGWYIVVGIGLVTLGFVLLRIMMRGASRRRELRA